jgi:hypothetical protein
VLVAAGADLDVTAKYRLTALMLAVVAGHAAVARTLARAGTDRSVLGTGAPGFAGKSAHDLAAARGDMDDLLAELRPAWHALLAPLPPGATVLRKPVASPDLVASGRADAIAGWEQLTVELSAGIGGLRHVMVTLEAGGRPISAGDTVLYCRERHGGGTEYRQESIGGRLEADGSFRGTRWRAEAVAAPGEDEPHWTMTPSEPTAEDTRALMALVAAVVAGAPPRP